MGAFFAFFHLFVSFPHSFSCAYFEITFKINYIYKNIGYLFYYYYYYLFTCAYIVWVISPLCPLPPTFYPRAPSFPGRTCSALISNFAEEKT
jgi:hypothetical protein